MIKDKLTSAARYVKDHDIEFGAAVFVIGITALAIKYPDDFVAATEPAPDIIVKIVHVHE